MLFTIFCIENPYLLIQIMYWKLVKLLIYLRLKSYILL